jgi:hypothetical protein
VKNLAGKSLGLIQMASLRSCAPSWELRNCRLEVFLLLGYRRFQLSDYRLLFLVLAMFLRNLFSNIAFTAS